MGEKYVSEGIKSNNQERRCVLEMYYNWASDPEVTKYLTWPAHTSLKVTRNLLEEWVPRYADG